MLPRAKDVHDHILELLSQWECVDAISLFHRGDDPNEPYFSLTYDVFCKGRVPSREERKEAFSFAGAYESARHREKDRMFVDEHPVRIEYRSCEDVDELVGEAESGIAHRSEDSYGFYRVLHGSKTFVRSEWLDETVRRVEELPQGYWASLRSLVSAKLEHSLADLRAAAVEDDQYFALVSQAGFLSHVSELIFAINMSFFPGERHVIEKLRELPSLPERFETFFMSLLRSDKELTVSRRAELATILTKAVFAL